MREDEAKRVVEGLRRRGLIAGVARQGVYRFGVRVPLGDGREALWDVDGAAGLEASIMRNNVLVGYVEQIPGSESYTEDEVVEAIATADYGSP